MTSKKKYYLVLKLSNEFNSIEREFSIDEVGKELLPEIVQDMMDTLANAKLPL